MKTIVRKLYSLILVIAVSSAVFAGLQAPVGAFPTETVYSSTNAGFGTYEDDESLSGVDIGFDFDFYGTTYDTLAITTNGTIGFNGANGDDFENADLTASSGLGDYLYPFWDDLDTGAGSVSYATIGTAPNRKFVTQWTDVVFHDTVFRDLPFGTFQAILYEGTNVIKFQYRYLLHGSMGYGDSATIGISDASDNFAQYSYNAASLGSGQAISFTPAGGNVYTVDSSASYESIFLQADDIPAASSFVYPANGAVGVSSEPILQWAPVVGVEYYDVYVSKSPVFPFAYDDIADQILPAADVVVDEEGLEDVTLDLAGTPLEYDTRYYWFVQSANFEGSTITDFGTFVTEANPVVFNPLPDGSGMPINLVNDQTIATNPYTIIVNPSSSAGIDHVEFWIDGVNRGNGTPNPDGTYSFVWDWSQQFRAFHGAPLDSYGVRILAYDTNGDFSEISRLVWVIWELPYTGR